MLRSKIVKYSIKEVFNIVNEIIAIKKKVFI